MDIFLPIFHALIVLLAVAGVFAAGAAVAADLSDGDTGFVTLTREAERRVETRMASSAHERMQEAGAVAETNVAVPFAGAFGDDRHGQTAGVDDTDGIYPHEPRAPPV